MKIVEKRMVRQTIALAGVMNYTKYETSETAAEADIVGQNSGRG